MDERSRFAGNGYRFPIITLPVILVVTRTDGTNQTPQIITLY